MKSKLIVRVVGAFSIALSGTASAQIPVTDVASITQSLTAHVLEYANMAAQYAQQIQQYETQIEQLDLQKIAAKVADVGQFDSTMEDLDGYKEAFNLEESQSKLGGLKNYSQLSTNGVDRDATAYLARLGQATDRKIELSNAQSELVTKRMESIESDRTNLKQLQDANANAEGEMQAAQIGNHINSEVLGQLVKMRQEQAAESQLQAEKAALDESAHAEEQAKKMAILKANAEAAEANRNRPKLDAKF